MVWVSIEGLRYCVNRPMSFVQSDVVFPDVPHTQDLNRQEFLPFMRTNVTCINAVPGFGLLIE